MANKSLQKGCLSVTAIVAFLSLVGIIIILILVTMGGMFFIRFFDEVTSSIDNQPTGDAFFESTGGWDYKRIPLIEPYQAINTNDLWLIDLETGSIRHQSTVGVTKLDIIDNKYIVTYGTDELYAGKEYDEVWFIIIPDENIEQGFTDEEEFFTYLKDNDIDEPNFRDLDVLYRELADRGYLEWFPDEYK
jgi:hypothetical protein